MTTRNTEPPPGDKGVPPAPPPPGSNDRSRAGNTVFKSGPLFISSKGIGWTSWKKRWFILTRTSLVFFRSDPSAVPQRGSEVNLTLGGIDLNNSGSVVVKADKKLLTVLFPDGRDGRAFTLKAETLEDLHEWKAALENALSQAPSACHMMGNGFFRNDQIDSADGCLDHCTIERPHAKTSVIGRPILLALEDIDGAPSFLEKALRFIEEHGVKVEGILRQAADVDEVERRVRDYEQGKNEFSPEEDAHIVADCIKHVLRELPSSPVPASCCNALLQACRTERNARVNAVRAAICESFPEPNRRLLQRILMMMRTVASYKAENRMSCSAVAACMAPLLLRPLLAGDCEIDNDFDVGGDGSIQLLQAAAAANHAQAIVITLLDEYDKIFGEGSMSPELYTDSEESGSETEEETDEEEEEEEYYEDDMQDSEAETDDDPENASGVTCSENGDSGDNNLYDDKDGSGSCSGSKSPEVVDDKEPKQDLSASSSETSLPQQGVHHSENELTSGTSSANKSTDHGPTTCIQKSNGPEQSVKSKSAWRRTAARKNLSMEYMDYAVEEEVEIQKLEVTKAELENRVAEEARENLVLRSSLEMRKKALYQRRLALEQDVAILQEQLQKERDLRLALEAGLKISQGPLPNLATVDEKTRVELEEIAVVEADVVNLTHKLDELGLQLTHKRELLNGPQPKSSLVFHRTRDHQTRPKDKQKDCEAIACSSHSEKSRSKDSTHLGGAEYENERKLESTILQNKHPPLNQQQPDPTSNYRSIGVSSDSSPAQPAGSKRTTPSHTRRSGTRGEGGNTTTSALSKLTTRLNFLKERRTQIAHELQNMDRTRGSGQIFHILEKGRELHQNPDRSQGVEVQSTQNPEKARELESYDRFQNLDRGFGIEGQSFQNQDKFRKSDTNIADRGKRTENLSTLLDRGKSENHISVHVDKSRPVEPDKPFVSSRTNSR
ncbi:hypothetical protein UlMin_034732 [Ulmus minor]